LVLNINPRPAATKRLFCFPYAGGSAAIIYRKWAMNLPEDLEVLPVELSGRGSRLQESLKYDMDSLVEELIGAIKNYIDKPYYFFGHSMGALVSYEIARRLSKKHLPLPEKLILSSHSAPQFNKRSPVMHKLPKDEFIRELKELNGMPKEFFESEELLDIFLPIIKADYTVCETYEFSAREKLKIPFIAIRGTNDQTVLKEDMIGWSDLTQSGFKFFEFPGDHFFITKNQDEFIKFVSHILYT